MDRQGGRFLRLFGNIFFSVVGLILVIALVLLGLRLITSGFDRIPWFNFFYMCLLLLMPPAFFSGVYIIFSKRTSRHPSNAVRWISRLLFFSGIASWAVILVVDLVEFFRNNDPDIDRYYCFNLLILFINICVIFFTGVLQALTAAKEKDWMDKYNK